MSPRSPLLTRNRGRVNKSKSDHWHMDIILVDHHTIRKYNQYNDFNLHSKLSKLSD